MSDGFPGHHVDIAEPQHGNVALTAFMREESSRHEHIVARSYIVLLIVSLVRKRAGVT
jgi:hypothetical protein